MNKYEMITNAIDDMFEDEIIKLYNEYADRNLYERIYDMDEFYPLIYSGEGRTVFEIKSDLEDVHEGDRYVSNHDVYGWQSFNYYADSPNSASTKEMADYVYQNEDALGNLVLSEIIFDFYTLGDFLNDLDECEDVDLDGEVKTATEWLDSLSASQLEQVIDYTTNDENQYVVRYV